MQYFPFWDIWVSRQRRKSGEDNVTEWCLWVVSPTDYEHNFNIYDDNYITDLNTPYDYESVMHYDPFSFNKNESIPTITTKIPEFNGIIGQRLDFSTIDLERLNRMYNCSEYLCAWGLAKMACTLILNALQSSSLHNLKHSLFRKRHLIGCSCPMHGL